MKITPILMAEVIGGLCILTVIVSLAVMSIAKVEIPPGVAALFAGVVTAFLTGIFGAVGHTIGFANGTTNGENAAQAEALRTVMGQKQNG